MTLGARASLRLRLRLSGHWRKPRTQGCARSQGLKDACAPRISRPIIRVYVNVIFGHIAGPFGDLGFSLSHVERDGHLVTFQDLESARFTERQPHAAPR